MLKPGQEVPLEDWLYRRSYCDPLKRYLNPDGTAHSRVFKVREKDQGRLSVDIRSMSSIDKSIRDATTYILFELPNVAVREIPPLESIYAPSANGSNDAHALILPLAIEDEVTPLLLANKSQLVKL
jgi:hypothetical protein